MKNLKIKFFYLLSFIFIFISCGDLSVKGSWSSSDMNKCKSEIKIGMYADGKEGADEMFTLLGTNVDELSACICERFEKTHSSFKEADNSSDLETMSDQEMIEMMTPCFSNSKGGWSEGMVDIFMQNCAIDPLYKGYCSCILEEVMEKYTVAEVTTLTEVDYANFETFEDCLELID
tara:strand:- start:44 stop:571 length:528 start_codon:yes stop_codon:yes gene_type:complete